VNYYQYSDGDSRELFLQRQFFATFELVLLDKIKMAWVFVLNKNKTKKGSSIHAYLTVFYYIGFGHIGIDMSRTRQKDRYSRTDISIYKLFINGYIGYDFIGHRTRFLL
jgi:hypothetical protein